MGGKLIPAKREATTMVIVARIVLVLLIVINLWFIWHNSAKVSKDSNKTSKKVATSVAKVVVKDYQKLDKTTQIKHVSRINNKVRSLGHFAEFVPLGLLFFMLSESLFALQTVKRWKRVVFCVAFSVLFSMVCALCDEIHQLFVKGRTFQVGDIFTDTFGALCGCMVAFAITLIFKKKIFK